MKRSKNDHIRSTISRYFKRRQFHESEMPSKKNAKRNQSVGNLTVKQRALASTNLENTFTLSSITGDTTACDQQFTRLKTFIQGAVNPYSKELQPLLFPMFVHVYLEMLCNGHKVPAHKFHDRHADIFQDGEHQNILKMLRNMESKSNLTDHKEIRELRNHHHIMNLDQEVLDYLMRHLKTSDGMIILQLFNQYVKVNVRQSGGQVELLPEADLSGANVKVEIKTEAGEESQGGKEPTLLEELESSIKAVRESPPCLPSICFFTFLNTFQGLCSTTISPDKSRLAGSFEDSTINIWSLEPYVFTPTVPDTDVSRISLAVDYLHCTEDEMKDKMKVRSNQSMEVAKLSGHRGPVYKTQFLTGSNQYALSCSADTSVRMWDLQSQTNTVLYKGHDSTVWDVSISSTDTWFASASHDTTAKLWSFERIYPLRSFVGHTFDVDCVEFHSNNNYVATGSGDKTVRLWSINDGRTMRIFQGHRGSVLALAFSPDGKLLATTVIEDDDEILDLDKLIRADWVCQVVSAMDLIHWGEDRRIRIWDLGSGQILKELRGHSDTVYALAFDDNSAMLASGGADCCIRVWDVKKAQDTPLREGESSPDLLGAFPTKSALVSYLKFSSFNILMSTGTSS